MQLGLVQFLLGSSAPGTGQTGEGGSGDLFSQLLGDMGADSGQQHAQAGLLSADVTPAALLAQELDPASLAALQRADTEALSDLLTQPVTAQDARALLDKMSALGFEKGQDEAFDQLHEALEMVETTGEATDVAQLLEALPVVEQAASPAERAPLMQRMLSFLHGAIEKKKEVPQDLAAASASADAVTQSLQASLFRAGDTGAETARTQETDTADATATAQTPTADAASPLILTMPPAAPAIPAWVRKISDESVPAEIDAAIPALTLADDETLPEVDLPDSGSVADDVVSAGEPKLAAKTAPEKTPHGAFAEQLAALPEPILVQDTESGQTVQVDSSGVAQVGHAAAASSHSSITPQTHSAIAHTTTHVAAAEQVQVAITTAAKDGLDTITLQLEPADLGRVEVRMEMGLDGRTQLHFTVDKAETMDALARDARSLERSLQEAGIKADAGSMQFNLRQQPQFADMGGGQQSRGGQQQAANDNDAVAPAATEGITRHYTINVREGVDIHA